MQGDCNYEGTKKEEEEDFKQETKLTTKRVN
jgi:hypothetical protein